MTLYIAVFVSERNANRDMKTPNLEINSNRVVSIIYDLLSKRTYKVFFAFLTISYATQAIDANISQLYITSPPLNFSKDFISMIKFASLPAKLILPFVSTFFTKDRPFDLLVRTCFLTTFLSAYMTFVLIASMPH